jgi:hypothetical protein
MDPSEVANPQGLMQDKGVKPAHVLMAASIMHDMGRLVEGSEARKPGYPLGQHKSLRKMKSGSR